MAWTSPPNKAGYGNNAVDADALASLANVKQQLHIESTDTTHDSFLARLINRASKICETFMSRKIVQKIYTEYYDGDGTPELILAQWPIISITSIHDDVDRAFGSDTLIAAADYLVYKERGKIVYTEGNFAKGSQNIKAIYTAGWASVPDDLQDACIQFVEHMFNRSATGGFTSASLGGRSEIYDMREIPAAVRRVLRNYKKHGHSSYSS